MDMAKRLLRVLSALTVTLTMVWAGSGPAGAVTVPGPAVPDGAVLIPGTQFPDTGQDEEGTQVAINDDYILSREAGDDPLNVETAASARFASAQKAKGLQATASATAAFNSAWAAIGPNPIIQIQRSDGALKDVSGRIGALAIRKNGRFILGAAQGGIWTMDPGTDTWVSRTDTLASLATGALEVAPSDDNVIYDGTGEGAFSGDSYFGNGILKSTDGGTTWTHVSGDFFFGVATARLAIDPNDADIHFYLGIAYIAERSPQAKGRIERLLAAPARLLPLAMREPMADPARPPGERIAAAGSRHRLRHTAAGHVNQRGAWPYLIALRLGRLELSRS